MELSHYKTMMGCECNGSRLTLYSWMRNEMSPAEWTAPSWYAGTAANDLQRASDSALLPASLVLSIRG